MTRIVCLATLLLGLAALGADPLLKAQQPPRPDAKARAEQPAGGDRAALAVVDNGGRPVEALEVGSSLLVAARGLEPNRTYEFRLGADGRQPASPKEAVSFARAGTDAKGTIAPLVLWYQSGVVGCSQRVKEGAKLPLHTYRTFEEAERGLRGQKLMISVHP